MLSLVQIDPFVSTRRYELIINSPYSGRLKAYNIVPPAAARLAPIVGPNNSGTPREET